MQYNWHGIRQLKEKQVLHKPTRVKTGPFSQTVEFQRSKTLDAVAYLGKTAVQVTCSIYLLNEILW